MKAGIIAGAEMSAANVQPKCSQSAVHSRAWDCDWAALSAELPRKGLLALMIG